MIKPLTEKHTEKRHKTAKFLNLMQKTTMDLSSKKQFVKMPF